MDDQTLPPLRKQSLVQQKIRLPKYTFITPQDSKICKRRNRERRAIEACEQCRKKKLKCDEAKPHCGTCKSNKTSCDYLTQLKSMTLILNSIEQAKTEGEVTNGKLRELHFTLRNCCGLNFETQRTAKDGFLYGHNQGVVSLRFLTTYEVMCQRTIGLNFPDFDPEYIRRGSARPLLNLYDRAFQFFQFPNMPAPNHASKRTDTSFQRAMEGSMDFSLRIDSNRAGYLVCVYATYVQEMFPFLELESVAKNIQCNILHSNIERTSGLDDGATVIVDEHDSTHFFSQSWRNFSGISVRPEVVEVDTSMRTLDIAVSMLVLALGAICEVTEHLVAPLEHQEVWMNFADDMQSMPSHAESPLQPLLMTNNYLSSDRNIDKVPGLKYYAFAVRILGEQLGGETLSHVQAFLLAGLYLNQLARVNESYSWIHRAGTTMQHLISRDKTISGNATLQAYPTQKETEYRIRAYWTCYQLESELLSQLDKPASGVIENEDQVTTKITAFDCDEEPVVRNFMAMVQTFKLMNKARSLYDSSTCSRIDVRDHRIYELNARIDALKRVSLPSNFGSIAIASEGRRINDARAKYMTNIVQCLITTPYILHSLEPGNKTTSVEYPNGSMTRHRSHIDQGTLDYIEAINAAALAFHGIHGKHRRLILPNIFTTAHALLGNLLIFRAYILHESKSGFISGGNWNKLLDPVTEVFQGVCNLSPVLLKGCVLLDRLRKKL